MQLRLFNGKNESFLQLEKAIHIPPGNNKVFEVIDLDTKSYSIFRLIDDIVVSFGTGKSIVVDDFYDPKQGEILKEFIIDGQHYFSDNPNIADHTKELSKEMFFLYDNKSINLKNELFTNPSLINQKLKSLTLRVSNPHISDVLFFNNNQIPSHLQIKTGGNLIFISGLGTMADYEEALDSIYLINDTKETNFTPRIAIITVDTDETPLHPIYLIIPQTHQGKAIHIDQEWGTSVYANEAEALKKTYSSRVNAEKGSLIISPESGFTYTPMILNFASDFFSFKTINKKGDDVDVAFSIHVEKRIGDIAQTDSESASVSASNSSSDSSQEDKDNVPVLFKIKNQPKAGTIQVNKDGSFSYIPLGSKKLRDNFAYEIVTASGAIFAINATVRLKAGTSLIDVEDDIDIASSTSNQSTQQGGISGSDPVANAVTVGILGSTATTLLALTQYNEVISSSDTSIAPDSSRPFSIFSAPLPTLAAVPPPLQPLEIKLPEGTGVPTIDNSNTLSINTFPFQVSEDGGLTIGALDLLGPNAGNLASLSILTPPQNGSAIIAPNGSLIYVPNPDFTGIDTITVQAVDNFGNIVTGVVTIQVTAVNDNPVAEVDNYVNFQGAELVVSSTNGVLANDRDVDGDKFFLVPGGTSALPGLTLNSDGSFTYQNPDPNFNGTVSFTYTIADPSGGTSQGTVFITITPNLPPTANPDAYLATEDTPLVINAANGVLINDTDPTNDSLIVGGFTPPPPEQGSLTLNPDGSFTFIPALNFNGEVQFTYYATDSGTPAADSVPTTVTITVTPVNDPPVALNDTFTVNEDTSNNVLNVLLNDENADVDGDILTIASFTNPTHGTLTLSLDGRSLIYTPDHNYAGADSFTYIADDGTELSNSATVNIVVTNINDAPVANPDYYFTPQDTTLSITLFADGFLANDTDPEGNPFTVTGFAYTGPGTLNVIGAAGGFIYTPALGFTGIDYFTYTADDDGNAANGFGTAPVFIDVGATAPESFLIDGTNYVVGTSNNDTINGTPGDEVLLGGLGEDIFIPNGGNDTIADFDMTQDHIDLSGLLIGENSGNIENYLQFIDNGATGDQLAISSQGNGVVDSVITFSNDVDLAGGLDASTQQAQILQNLIDPTNGVVTVDT